MNKICFTIALLITCTIAQGQLPMTLDLDAVLGRAQQQSPSYYASKNRAENSYWAYKTFRAGLLPQLRLNATLPQYTNAIDRIIQPDGSANFRQRELTLTSADISLNQAIPLTGGTFNISSALQRNRNFQPADNTDYFSTPIIASYNQPLILYNPIKWENRIQPMLYEESRRRYVEDMERINVEASNFFFNALDAQIQFEVAQLNYANQDTLYEISKGRYNLGRIAENELLQIELSKLNAESTLAEAEFNLETAQQNLKRFLGISMDQELSLRVPTSVPNVTPNLSKALEEAAENRQIVLEFSRARIEAEQEIARARGTSGFDLRVSAGFGVSNQGNTLESAYGGDRQQQQFATVTLGVPLLDWGLMKARVRQAQANRELVEVNIQQSEVNFEQEILLQIMRFKQQQQQLVVAAKADTVAQKRFEVTKQRYYIGKIDITNLNLAQQEKDQARRAYIAALRNYWLAHFTLRRLTLYDFENDQKLNFVYWDDED